MKRVLLILTMVISCSLLASCEPETLLKMSQTTLSFDERGGDTTIILLANKVWEASSNQSWCKVSPTLGDGSCNSNFTLSVSCDANTTYDERSCTITVVCEKLTSTITVTQAEGKGLIVSQTEYNLTNEEQSISVEVQANVQYTVSIDDACKSWIKQESTKGLSSNTIKFAISKNESYYGREGKITVKQTDGSLSGTVVVKQSQLNGLFVSASEYNLSKEKHTLTVEVKANVEYDVVIPDTCKDWISIVGTKGLSSRYYTIAIAKNETYDNREGSITFKQKNGSLSGTVKVYQSQTDGLIAEKKEYIVSYEEQQLNIKVASNIEYEVNIDEGCRDWLSRVQTKGLTEETLTFRVTKNEGGERTGKIIFKSSTIQESVLIRQRAEGNVVFEDANFKAYCVTNYDKNGDGEISMAEARDITKIIIDTDNISSLQGIEEMPNLKQLSCCGIYKNRNRGKLTSLDVSKNTSLEIIDCYYNQLTSLDVSKNSALNTLNCGNNQFTSLDVSKNTALTGLYCSDNPLTSLDVSKNTALTVLSCSHNPLTSLDVSKNTALTHLECSSNQLTSLDVRKNTALISIFCTNNQLMSLDVSKNTALTGLYCSDNPLTSLDVSKNTVLKELRCDYNQLTSLDVSKNTALISIFCTNNQLTSLDVSKNTALTGLYCSYNQLTSLDVSKNTALMILYCHNNQLTSLDVSNNLKLEYLRCMSNPYLKEIWLKTGQTFEEFQYDKDVATIYYK